MTMHAHCAQTTRHASIHVHSCTQSGRVLKGLDSPGCVHRHRRHRTHRQRNFLCHSIGLYVGSMPLVGWERLPSLITSLPLARHTFVLIGDAEDENQECVWADFLPLNPTSPATALTMLTGGRAPGELRVRRLLRFASGQDIRTWYIAPLPSTAAGTTSVNWDELQAHIHSFHRSWDSRVCLLDNNCRHHTHALVQHLTGGTDVTSQSRSKQMWLEDVQQWLGVSEGAAKR